MSAGLTFGTHLSASLSAIVMSLINYEQIMKSPYIHDKKFVDFFFHKIFADDATLIAQTTNENPSYSTVHYQYFLPSVLPVI